MDYIYPGDNWLLTLLTELFLDSQVEIILEKGNDFLDYAVYERNSRTPYLRFQGGKVDNDIYADPEYFVKVSSKWTGVWIEEAVFKEESDLRSFVYAMKAAEMSTLVSELKRPKDEEKRRQQLIKEYARIEFTARGGRENLPYTTDGFLKLSCDDATHVAEQFSNGQDLFVLNHKEQLFVRESKNPICAAILELEEELPGVDTLAFRWCHGTFEDAYNENDGHEIGMSYYPHEDPTGLEYLLFHMDPRER